MQILLLQVLTWATFSSALIIPFYFSKWVLNTDVFLLFWIYQIAILLFEIPTWVVSSKFWEKTWLFAAYVFMFLFFVLLNFWQWFIYFAVLQLILAISRAFQSWSIHSLIYDFALENKINHKKLRADYQILWLMIWLITTILWSFLVLKLWYTQIFYIEAILFLIAAIYMLSFEIKKTHKWQNAKCQNAKNITEIFKNSLIFLWKNKNIMFSWFILYFLLWLEAWIYISMQDIYLNWLLLPLEYLWWVLALLTIVSIFFTKIISKVDYKYMVVLLWISLLSFILASISNYYFSWLLVFMTFFATQIVRWVNILIDDKLLSKIDNWIWSCVLSLLGFSERLIFFSFSLIIFIFKVNALLVILILSLVLLFLYMFYKFFYQLKISTPWKK